MNENTATTVGQIHAEGTSFEEQKPQEPVTVSMKKLIAGVGTVFAGVIEMLEALEPHVAQHLVDVAVQHTADEKKSTDVKSVQSGYAPTAGSVFEHPEETVKEPVAEADAQTDTAAAVSEERPSEESQNAGSDTPAVNTVTEDDLTKIIVRKIKQNRSNNEKIGAILRTYGVSKVSELPVSKYEAFLTDVSQL